MNKIQFLAKWIREQPKESKKPRRISFTAEEVIELMETWEAYSQRADMHSELPTEIVFLDGDYTLTAMCPDEHDEEMNILIEDCSESYLRKSNFGLTLDDAEDLGNYLISHVKNARESNPS